MIVSPVPGSPSASGQPPLVADFTTYTTFTGCSATDAAGGLQVHVANTSGDNMDICLLQNAAFPAYPSTWTLTVGLTAGLTGVPSIVLAYGPYISVVDRTHGANHDIGVTFGLQGLSGDALGTARAAYWEWGDIKNIPNRSGPGNAQFLPINGNPPLPTVPLFIRLQFNGSNFIFGYGNTPSSLTTALTISATAFLTVPDGIGLLLVDRGVDSAGLTSTFNYYRLTTP